MRGRRASGRSLSQGAWLRHLARHVPVAAEGADPEGVHQVRVAAGRLAVWLEMGGRAVLRDDLRDLRRSAAAVRDCDVLLLRGVPEPFAARLRERRDEARARMLEQFHGPRLRRDSAESARGARMSRRRAPPAPPGRRFVRPASPALRALRLAISLLPPLRRSAAEASLARFRDRVLRRAAALAAAERPTDDDFHRVRRAVRKLRYAVEWLGRDASEVKAVQQVFGDLNDLAVEAQLLAETGAASELPVHARTLRLRIAAKRRSALVVWRDRRAAIEAIR